MSSIPVEFVEYDEFLAIESALASASAAFAETGVEGINTAVSTNPLRKRKIISPIAPNALQSSSLKEDLCTELLESPGDVSVKRHLGAQVQGEKADLQSSDECIGFGACSFCTGIETATTKHDESRSAEKNEAKKEVGFTRRIPSWPSATANHHENSLVDTKPCNNFPEKTSFVGPLGWDESLITERSNGYAWGLVPSGCKAVIKKKSPNLQFKGRIVYSSTLSDAEEAAHELFKQVESKKAVAVGPVALGFDTEWKAIFTRGTPRRKVAVLQLCGDASESHVFHIIHSGIPTTLKKLLEDPTISKVGVGAYGDAAKISLDYNVQVKGIQDLCALANKKLRGSNDEARFGKSWSLSSLAEELLGKQVDKTGGIRTSDWEVDQLSTPQLQYAATDAFASLYLFQVLMTFPDPKEEVT